ncbi:MAG TPA: hemolysin family protein, partial [Myxococcota bacterium]
MVFELSLVGALLVLHGFLAGSEIAVVSLRKTRLRQLVDAGSSSARAVEALRKNPERFLATVQIFITVVGTIIAARGAPTLEALVRPAFDAVGLPAQAATYAAFAIAVATVSFAELVVGELVPKSLALRASEPYSLLVGRPLLWLSSAARPAVWLLEGASNAVLRVFGDRTSFIESRLSPDELTQLLEEAGRAGSLDARAADIAVRGIAFEGLTAADVMVPRNRVVAVSRAATPDELKKLFLDRGHQRLPVYDDDNADDVVGYIAARDLLAQALTGGTISVDELLRPAKFVPESMKVTEVLRELQEARGQLAIVVDERGGMAGLVTMEDLLEELVGDIWSEGDRAIPTPIRTMRDGTALVLGTVPIRDVNRALDIDLPEGELWTTIAGYCISLAGRIPESGARLTAVDGTILEIL